MSIPETRYAKSGYVHIAYQVVGDGPFGMVFVPGFVSNVEAVWSSPPRARFLQGLASFCRLILFDKRGTGMSDRTSQIFTLEQRMEDVHAVMKAAGSERAALFGFSEGGPMSILFASTYPRARARLSFTARMRSARGAPLRLDRCAVGGVTRGHRAELGETAVKSAARRPSKTWSPVPDSSSPIAACMH